MKRIFKISTVLALVLGASSCDMDMRPYSVIDPENALESYADAAKLANGFNIQVRNLAVGSKNYMTEIQSDIFHAVADFGNRGGEMFRWEFNASSPYAESLWASCYTAIANANYFIEKAGNIFDKVAEDEEFAKNWSENELEKLKGHISEAYFVKAYANYLLVDRFCETYSEANATKADGGIPIVDKYQPTSDKEKYPARETLKDSFDAIYGYLEKAEENIGLVNKNAAGSTRITADAVKALRARVALSRSDYPQAIQDATDVINSSNYSLVSGSENLAKLFVNDNVDSEVILQSYVAIPSEKPYSNDYGYMGYNYQKDFYAPDYLPEKWLVDLYSDKDYRKSVFFKVTPITLSSGTTEPVYIFSKFPGNPALMSGPSDYNYLNAPKPFRLAELYLIAAEAYAKSNVSIDQASALLNELQSRRIADWEDVTYTATSIIPAIQDERVRELVGEGFRLSDLKRYGKGVSRSAAQNSNVINLPGSSTTEFLTKTNEDYKFIWPIPTAETDANPKIKQNPGYTN